jgi:hypothetical protein
MAASFPPRRQRNTEHSPCSWLLSCLQNKLSGQNTHYFQVSVNKILNKIVSLFETVLSAYSSHNLHSVLPKVLLYCCINRHSSPSNTTTLIVTVYYTKSNRVWKFCLSSAPFLSSNLDTSRAPIIDHYWWPQEKLWNNTDIKLRKPWRWAGIYQQLRIAYQIATNAVALLAGELYLLNKHVSF